MAIAGRILVVLGAGLLLLAIFLFLAALMPNGGWGPSGADFGLRLATLPGVPGICAFLLGAFLVQRARKLRKLNETLEWNNRSLRGIVCDRTGVPIPKATVDVFVEDSQGRQPVTSVQTDAHGRFSANLPEGQYLLEVGAPELGESSIQVGVSKPGTNAELQIKLELTRSTA